MGDLSDVPTSMAGSYRQSTPASLSDPLVCSMSSYFHRSLQAQNRSTKKEEDRRPLISRVPQHLRELDSKAYGPQFISIGPYHHGALTLQAAQDHKWRYAFDLLSRNHHHEISSSLAKLIGSVRDIEAWLRSSYSESTDHMESDRFVEMMVLDGCFVVELLIKFYTRNREDPIFSVPWMLPLIRRDLLKLENQIPFFLLQHIFDLVQTPPATNGNPFPTLPEIAYIYLAFKRCPDLKNLSGTQIHHLLHLYDWTLSPPSSPLLCEPQPSVGPGIMSRLCLRLSKRSLYSAPTIPSASQLLKAGVKLQRRMEADSLLNISFKGNVLEIPQLSVVDGTNPIFRNLIALEQCCPDTKEPLPLKHFTSYALFWSCVVQTPEDVAVLRQHGIIENKLGSDEEVARFLSLLCKEVIINYSGHHFVNLFEAVNGYYGSKLKMRQGRRTSRNMKEHTIWALCLAGVMA